MKQPAMRNRLARVLVPGLVLVMATAWAAAATNPVLGFWNLQITFGERNIDSKLRIFIDEAGELAGTWSGGMGNNVVTDVACNGDRLTFRRTTTYENQEFVSRFEGTLSGDSLSAIIKSDWGEATVIGQRGEPDFAGKWALTSTSQRGPRTQVLTITEEKTGTIRFGETEIALKDLVATGGQLSFAVERTGGERTRRTTYRGTLEGDALIGESVSERGERAFTGRQLAGKALVAANRAGGQLEIGRVAPVRSEVITPIRNETLDKNGDCPERRQGGNPREVAGYLVFDGSMDGYRQVDPQIAVGGGYVLHATNNGIIIYDKSGHFVRGVSQNCFNGGIDPKVFYDTHNRVFGFDLWNPWDEAEQKPVNISVSETSDPTGAWNTYPVPAPGGRDGGGIGFSRKWIAYSFPGGSEQTFVLRMAEAKAGTPATAYHFSGSLGHPVATQDAVDDLYFVQLTDSRLIIRRVTDRGDGTPVSEVVSSTEHGLEHVGYPPQSPQKGTDQKTASGDRNPKNLVLQGGYIWFSQAVNYNGRSAVQWHQVTPEGAFVQTGLLSHPESSYIQTTLAVNKNLDVLVGFQETSPTMYISPRLAFRYASDPKGSLREMVALGEGQGATDGTSWGDYSGSTVDGDNLLDLWTIQSITDPEGKGDTLIARVPMTEVHAETTGTDAFLQNQRLGRGVNILGYDRIWRSREEGRFKAAYFQKLKSAGFQTVRINLHPFRHMNQDANRSLPASWFETLDWAVTNAAASGLMVILDLHEFGAMGDDPEGNRPRFHAAWRQLSEHFRDAPDRVLFEILNEPAKELGPELWNQYLGEALAIIRESNPARTVIVGPPFWNGIGHLPELSLPADDRNIIVTVHYYTPMEFTHQGASWSSHKDKSNVDWLGTTEEREAIRRDFTEAAVWSKEQNRPLFLGEFGAYDKAPMASRIRYTDAVARTAEAFGWSWAYWQFDSDFILYDIDRDAWVQPIRDALIPISDRAALPEEN